MDKFTNRALCANFRKVVKTTSLWYGRVVAKTPDGKIVDRNKTFTNYWGCKGFVDETYLHLVDYSCTVISSGCYACVPCQAPGTSDRGNA